MENTIIQYLGNEGGNKLYIKRDDLIHFSFGGNKARKGSLFFKEIDAGDYDCIVTYGSSSSNHCRVIANMAARRKMLCYIISPKEIFEETFNSQMMKLFDARVVIVPVEEVNATIELILQRLKNSGAKPYFIQGGGHGNIGTQAYVECYNEICEQEKKLDIHFDYIFHASGTGTTQAGLICGRIINDDSKKIVGISIARKNPKGRQVVIDSTMDYLKEKSIPIDRALIEKNTIFVDDYVGNGYGQRDVDIDNTILKMLTDYGIPMDATYTAKAFMGMGKFIRTNNIENKNILFIHTGGTPLFFDELRKMD